MPLLAIRHDRQTITALLVAMVFFMENLDATVISSALPAMAADFRTVPAYLSVGVSAYLVALTVFIPVGGWAVDRFGARRIFASAIVVFTLASLLCATSRGLWRAIDPVAVPYLFIRLHHGLVGREEGTAIREFALLPDGET